MASARKGTMAMLVGASLLLFGCGGENKPQESKGGPAQVPATQAEVFSSFDNFNEALAKRVTERITGKPMPDFLVVAVPGGAYPIGTLLRQSPMIPVSAAACQPPDGSKEVLSTSAPTLFPAYSMTRKVAAGIGLDDSVFEGIAKAGVKASQDSAIRLSISETVLDVWSDLGLVGALSTDSCRKALKPKTTYLLVRGLVKGKREFVVDLSRTGSANVDVMKVGNLQLEVGGGGSTMKVSDAKPEVFVMIVSEATLPSTKTEEVKIAAPSTPAASSGGSTIYVQQDSADDPATGRKIVGLLQAQKLNVIQLVERIPSSKMPKLPQVRYFHATDEAKAEDVLSIVKQQYPQALLVAIRLPTPEGHLEVWLPRVGGGE